VGDSTYRLVFISFNLLFNTILYTIFLKNQEYNNNVLTTKTDLFYCKLRRWRHVNYVENQMICFDKYTRFYLRGFLTSINFSVLTCCTTRGLNFTFFYFEILKLEKKFIKCSWWDTGLAEGCNWVNFGFYFTNMY